MIHIISQKYKLHAHAHACVHAHTSCVRDEQSFPFKWPVAKLPLPVSYMKKNFYLVILWCHVNNQDYTNRIDGRFNKELLFMILFISPSVDATFFAYPILLDLITLIIHCEDYKLWSSHLIIQSSPGFCHFLSLRSRYFPHFPIFIHLQSLFFS